MSGSQNTTTTPKCIQDIRARAAITFSQENLAKYRASQIPDAQITQGLHPQLTLTPCLNYFAGPLIHSASSFAKPSIQPSGVSTRLTSISASTSSDDVSRTDGFMTISTGGLSRATENFIKDTNDLRSQPQKLTSLSQPPFTFPSTLPKVRVMAAALDNVSQKPISMESKRRADHRASLSDKDKDRIRLRDKSRKAESRAAIKLTKPPVTSSAPLIYSQHRKKQKHDSQSNLRANLTEPDILNIRKTDTAQRAAARVKLSEQNVIVLDS
jgi:hypothetical protein